MLVYLSLIDNEDVEKSEYIISGKTVASITKDDYTILYWFDSRNSYEVSGNLDESELLKMVKKMVEKNKK